MNQLGRRFGNGFKRDDAFDSHQDVAYSTNTLAAWDMALLASFDTFTPSGSCGEKQIEFNLDAAASIRKRKQADII